MGFARIGTSACGGEQGSTGESKECLAYDFRRRKQGHRPIRIPEPRETEQQKYVDLADVQPKGKRQKTSDAGVLELASSGSGLTERERKEIPKPTQRHILPQQMDKDAFAHMMRMMLVSRP